jgi:hypothetical protein
MASVIPITKPLTKWQSICRYPGLTFRSYLLWYRVCFYAGYSPRLGQTYRHWAAEVKETTPFRAALDAIEREWKLVAAPWHRKKKAVESPDPQEPSPDAA